MVDWTHSSAALIIAVVGLVNLGLVAMAILAWRRTQNPKLLWVTGAFSAFAIKSLLTSWALTTGGIAHQHLELVGGLFDLGIVAMLVAPFLGPRA